MPIMTSEIKQYVEQNLKEIDSIYSIADQLQVSYHTLRKTFLKKEKVSLGRYITAQKVNAMKEMLMMDRRKCYFICFDFGLREDTGAKVFKRSTGMTMKEYRKMKLKERESGSGPKKRRTR